MDTYTFMSALLNLKSGDDWLENARRFDARILTGRFDVARDKKGIIYHSLSIRRANGRWLSIFGGHSGLTLFDKVFRFLLVFGFF